MMIGSGGASGAQVNLGQQNQRAHGFESMLHVASCNMQIFAWHFIGQLHVCMTHSKDAPAAHGHDEGEEEDSGVEECSIRVDWLDVMQGKFINPL